MNNPDKLSGGKPILFSADMVKAILSGDKTMTRRIANEFPRHVVESAILKRYPNQHGCRYGEQGDCLWVREAFKLNDNMGGCRVSYRADASEIQVPEESIPGDLPLSDDDNWRPSIFMPRWASRIDLEIVSVRVERLQDITWEDASKEGVKPWTNSSGDVHCPGCIQNQCPHPRGSNPGFCPTYCEGYRDSFRKLWDKINGAKHPWENSPWVWAITFKVIKPTP